MVDQNIARGSGGLFLQDYSPFVVDQTGNLPHPSGRVHLPTSHPPGCFFHFNLESSRSFPYR
jgi:hypothetical protein